MFYTQLHPAKSFLILQVLFLLIATVLEVSAQSEADSTSAKGGLDEIYIGGSLREAAHLGLSFGKTTTFAIYGGGWEGLLSCGLGVKMYRKKPGWAAMPSKGFTRIASGMLFERGDNSVNVNGKSSRLTLELLYFAFTIGRDFYFNPHLGMSLEGGLMLVPQIEGTLAQEVHFVMPAVGIKFFYKRRAYHK